MTMKPTRLKRGSRRMQFIIEQYQAAHPDEGSSVRPDLVAEWAIEKGVWSPQPISPQEQLRRLLSRSLRETYIIDPQGREVRASLPIIEEVPTRDGPKKRSRWYPIFEADAKVARASFSLRRKRALADVVQLQFDFMSWNENNSSGDALDPLDFNFNKDLADLSQPTEYPEEPEGDGFADIDEDEEEV